MGFRARGDQKKVPKQTRASTNYRNRRSVVPPAAPRGLNQEIGTACFLQISLIAMSMFDGNRMLIVFESSGIAFVRFLAM